MPKLHHCMYLLQYVYIHAQVVFDFVHVCITHDVHDVCVYSYHIHHLINVHLHNLVYFLYELSWRMRMYVVVHSIQTLLLHTCARARACMCVCVSECVCVCVYVCVCV